jgi:hypothetical protein
MMLRTTVVLVLAFAAAFGTWWISHPAGANFAMAYIGPYSPRYFFEESTIRIVQQLVPGFIVGALLQSRQLLAGAIVSGTSSAAIQNFHDLNSAYFEGWAKVLIDMVEPGTFGLAAAALGMVALGSNYSFQRIAMRILGSSKGR